MVFTLKEIGKMLFRTSLLLYRCLTCQQNYRGRRRVCDDCFERLPWLQRNNSYDPQDPLAYRKLFCFHYAMPINHMIKAWKFDGSMFYKSFFANCLIDTIRNNITVDDIPEGLIAVPISKKRCQERGFNQALQLGKQLAKHLKIKRYDGALGCRFQKKHQASLSAEERKQHLRNTFYMRRRIKLPKHMAIIDDVMTTGSTLQAIAKLLLKNGVEKIEYWGIARVLYMSSQA